MQQTIDQFKNLQLFGVLEAWQEQQTLKTYHDLTFDERFALGVSLENNDHLGVNFGWDIQRKFRVAYNFSVTISKLNNSVSGGIHQLSIGYLLKN